MFDTLTPRSTTGEFETIPSARPDPSRFLLEARTGTHESAAHMKDLANVSPNCGTPLLTCLATRPATNAPGSATGFSISRTH